MIEDMRLAGLAENTRKTYVQAVRTVTEYFMRPPDELADGDLRRYFAHVTTVRTVPRKTLGVYLGAIRFLFIHTLGRKPPCWTWWASRAGARCPTC